MTYEALVNYVTTTPQGSEKLALILTQEVRQLSAFERRALSRRKICDSSI
jgi:hypothetical protein